VKNVAVKDKIKENVMNTRDKNQAFKRNLRCFFIGRGEVKIMEFDYFMGGILKVLDLFVYQLF